MSKDQAVQGLMGHAKGQSFILSAVGARPLEDFEKE